MAVVAALAAALLAYLHWGPANPPGQSISLHGGGPRLVGHAIRLEASVAPPSSPEQAPMAFLRLGNRTLRTVDPAAERQPLQVQSDDLPPGLHSLILERGVERSEVRVLMLPRWTGWTLALLVLGGATGGAWRLLRSSRG